MRTKNGTKRSDSAGSEKVKDERADELKAARWVSIPSCVL